MLLWRSLPALLIIGAVAAPAEAASLKEALAAAYAGNPTLEAARADLRATDEGVPQVLSEWRPSIIGQAQGGREWDKQRSPLELQLDTRPRSYGVTVRQPIFDGFGTVYGTSAAENRVEAGRARLIGTEQSVLLDAVTAYMNVVRDTAVLDLTRNNEKVLAAQLEATEARFEVGELTRTDVAQAQSRLQGAIAQRIQAEGQLTSSRAIYRQVIGEDPADVAMPADAPAVPANREEAIALAQAAPGVRAAQFDERAAKDDIDVQFSDMLPTVAVEGSFERRQEFGGPDSEVDVASVLGTVTVPLYQAGAPDSRVRQSKQRYMQSRRLTEEARRAAEQEAISAWQGLGTAVAQSQSFEEQVKAAELALEGVRAEQQVGARTILDVLDAEQEALNARVNLVSAQTARVVAQYRLLAAGGALTAANLALNVEYYDPQRHYDEVRHKFFGTGPGVE